MFTKTAKTALAAALISGAVGVSSQALAGECPADQVMKDAVTAGETMPKGVTDDVLSSIDLSFKGEAWKGHMFRLRRLVIEAGGVVPWHQHDVRPANIMVIEGSITEYSSNCKVPVEHKAGEVAQELIGLAHWWRNNSDKPVVLISADILPPQMAEDHTM